MPRYQYDEDSDSGDISLLSLPHSRSSPQLSTILNGPGYASGSGSGGGSGGLASPTPQRLLGKNLWNKPSTTSGISSSINGGSSNSNSNRQNGGPHITISHGTGSRQRTPVPLVPPANHGDSPSDDDSDAVTPLGTPSTTLWGSDRQQQHHQPKRPSSALPPITTASLDTFSSNPSSQSTPHAFTRRTSSSGSITRSKSMNVRLPSVDLSSTASSSSSNATAFNPTTSVDGPYTSSTLRAPASAISRTPSTRIGYNRRPGDPRPPPLVLDHVSASMKRWVKEIVVCNFDLERGPVIERRVMGRRWGPGEKENVAFSSFPDTSLFAEGSIMFSFKIRHIPPDPSSLSLPEPPSPLPDRKHSPSSSSPATAAQSEHLGDDISRSSTPLSAAATGAPKKSDNAEEYRKWDERGREWLYGFVWFEQRRDGGIARGYMQKSLVILTHLPFPALYFAVLQRVAPIFFEHGYSALEAACHSIASWPDPIPDKILDLPLMSELLNVKLPDTNETPQVGYSGPSPERPILASLPPSSPIRTFASVLPSLWSLWECLILAEPVLVIAPDPKTCSEIVWWLRDLLRPIPPAGDFRPYLHIHDHDFPLLVNSNKPQAGVVVGVTNPFFRNAASHWPNVISIPPDRPRRTNHASSQAQIVTKPDQPEGFVSRRHRSVLKDRPLLKRLEQLVSEGKHDDPSANEALRTHFQQLTEKMLVPLNRYFQTLVPTLSPSPQPQSQPSSSSQAGSQSGSPLPPVGLGSLKPFSLPAFLTHLKTKGPNPLSFRTKGLSTKSRVESDFYTTFCMSPTFAGWLAARVTSLGIAVAANTQAQNVGYGGSGVGSSLTVPTGHTVPVPRHAEKQTAGGIGLGINATMADLALSDGRSSPQPPQSHPPGEPRDSTDGSETISSGSSVVGHTNGLGNGGIGPWRMSNESSISASGEYGGGRRGSESVLRAQGGR